MLFLAVFCGFFAEYQLEHKIEKDRAKELARSLYEELQQDSINMSVRVNNRFRQEASLKWLMQYFKDSSTANVSKTFQFIFSMVSISELLLFLKQEPYCWNS